MSRIKINDLRSELKLNRDDLRRIYGGVTNIPPTVASMTGGNIPFPFSNFGSSGDSGESNVQISGGEPNVGGSSGSSSGDEAGTSGGGIASGGASGTPKFN
jgi:hypothetical protein